ncbi:hypothetical protein N0V88_007726 [Collariella sp. IMI 366227]|nr:hypothetical protein N0V88_007726 [Collariella sp. IMI 366227]
MATISFYEASIGLALNSSLTLRGLLTKAQSHPDAATFANARLAPDMFALGFQVEAVSNFSKKAVERLTGRTDIGVWEDKNPRVEGDVYNMDELIARLDKTVALLETVKREDVDAAADKTHTLTLGPLPPMNCTTSQYLLGSRGVDVGKKDFLIYFMADIFPKAE